jgi:signal transduction histidine kinase
LAQRNLVLSQALDAVHRGDLEAAQRVIDTLASGTLNLAQVFRLHHAELETQALQRQDSQRRTEQALDWYAHLFRALPVAAILVDDRGLIADANAQALDDLGLRRAVRSLHVPLRRLVADTQCEMRLSTLLPTILPGETQGMDDVALRTLDGHLRWADMRLTGVPPQADGPPGNMVLCVFNDRTTRVEALRAREAAAHAEHERDLAESASLAKTQLLSRVSHELRTPLNAVIGFSQLLLMYPDRLDADSQRKVQHIQKAGQQLLDLVDEVLQINRAEAGKLLLDLQPVDLRAVARSVVSLQEPMANDMQLSLELDEDGPSLAAFADERRVVQILTNLVANAIKYNRRGGVLRIGFGANDRQTWVQVADSGIGMNAQQLTHLFEPFNRLGADRLAVGGHGLGLSIARTLAQAMGGTLEVQSTPGEGSIFTLGLPLAITPKQPAF